MSKICVVPTPLILKPPTVMKAVFQMSITFFNHYKWECAGTGGPGTGRKRSIQVWPNSHHLLGSPQPNTTETELPRTILWWPLLTWESKFFNGWMSKWQINEKGYFCLIFQNTFCWGGVSYVYQLWTVQIPSLRGGSNGICPLLHCLCWKTTRNEISLRLLPLSKLGEISWQAKKKILWKLIDRDTYTLLHIAQNCFPPTKNWPKN